MLTYQLIKASRHLKNHLDHALSDFKITASQFAVMNQIHMMDNRALAYEIADILTYDRPTISGIIKRLEDKALLSRQKSHNDKRMQYLALTPEGISLLGQMQVIADDLSQSLFDYMPDKERQIFELQLCELIRRLEVKHD